MSKSRMTGLLFLMQAAMTLLLLGCQGDSRGSSTGTRPSADVEIRVIGSPSLYEPFDLAARIDTKGDLQGPIEAWFELPPSVAYIDGHIRWSGTIEEDNSYELRATLAFVAEGRSHLRARIRFPNPDTIDGSATEGDGIVIGVTSNGSEEFPDNDPGVRSFVPGVDAAFYPDRGGPELDGYQVDLLPNVMSARALSDEGLADVPDVMLQTIESHGGVFAIVLRGPVEDTTGHHFAILNTTSGYAAQQEIGREPSKNKLLLINAIALGPSNKWPVRQSQVSPTYVKYFSYSLMDEKDGLDIVVRVNDEEVGSYSFQRDELLDAATMELPMAVFAERALQ